MFCLVAITYTSPKVSVTANKRVPRKKKRVLRVSNLKYVSNQLTLPRISLVSNIRVYVYFCFDILILFLFFSMYKNWLRG